MTTVHVVLPDGIDDPARPSGGNVYDRRLCRELIACGWSVREHEVAGAWPHPDAASLAALDGVVAQIPDGAVVLLDGLVASTAPAVLVPHARRVRLVVLVHMPLGHRPGTGEAGSIRERERAVLTATAAIVTTSAWTRGRLAELYGLPPGRIHVAAPGSDPAPLAAGTDTGGALLCVAAVTFDKGHDVLVAALATIADRSWRCACVGSLQRDPDFAGRVRARARDAGLEDRVSFPGPLTGADLDRRYAAADLVVLASRAETYGMVIAEALVRGLPVIAAQVGGVPEALGHGADDIRPGVLVAPDDAEALGAALRAWLSDASLRDRLRRAAAERRETLSRWPATASVLAGVLAGAA
ncbi:MAG TPA: glycosyltransferase family 4 protein [Solirubrobacteraceae bacterium]|nr:glycosyltransferase family 4 protein [Solirubrobacteraceae bacterium]